jgi:hypothetical protein
MNLVHRYEVANKQHSSLFQLVRLRVHDGFYLVKILKTQSSSANKQRTTVEIHMKKYFTPTIYFLYKITYSTHNTSKFDIEIWIGYSFLNFKSKYQNVYLSEQIRLFLLQIQKSDFDRTFELTHVMTNPPEILKYKEPLFKLMLSFRDDPDLTGNEVFSFQNMNFTLNKRPSMASEFTTFATAWFNLSFFRYNKHTMNKFYNTHVIKLILDYDKPVPNITTFLFDAKNSASSSSSMPYQQSTASIFKCQSSLNKLYAMFADWCDVVLMENCVYLKLIELSTPCREKSVGGDQQSEISDNEQQDVSNSNDFLNMSSQSAHLNKSAKQMNASNNGSCLLIRMDTQYAPYVSVQFLFHASIPYLECLCLLNTFEEKIKQLNLQSFASNFLSATNEKAFSNALTSRDNDENNSTTTPTTTPTGGTSQTNLSSAVNNNSSHNANPNSYNNSGSSNEVNECCHILKKTDIFETIKSWLFDETNKNLNKVYFDPNTMKDNLVSQIPNALKTNYLASNF